MVPGCGSDEPGADVDDGNGNSGGTKGDATCGGGNLECEGSCIDATFDPNNCGECGNECDEGELCSAGKCGFSCFGGTTECGGSCVDTDLDGENCGECGETCDGGEVCSNGTCALRCVGGTEKCGDSCVNAQTDPANCGGCGVECKSGEMCSAGECQVDCAEGLVNCGGECINPDVDRRYCGAVGACEPSDGEAGAGGAGGASGVDRGDAGVVCADGNVCNGGACEASCGANQVACDGACIDPRSDPKYCGATGDCSGADSGTVCDPGMICRNQGCVSVYLPGLMEDLPAHGSSYSGNVRGYWFEAPEDMVITGIRVPNELVGPQSIQVMRMNSGPPPEWGSTTLDYTTLIYIQQDPTTEFVSVELQIEQGDFIGILGQRGGVTSYAPNPATIQLGGNDVVIRRFGSQVSITAAPAAAVWTESGGSIGRVELQVAFPE